MPYMIPTDKIVSVTLTDKGTIEVVRRSPSKASFYLSIHEEDVTKEIYIANGGIIEKKETIRGRILPAYTVPESITFPEE